MKNDEKYEPYDASKEPPFDEKERRVLEYRRELKRKEFEKSKR